MLFPNCVKILCSHFAAAFISHSPSCSHSFRRYYSSLHWDGRAIVLSHQHFFHCLFVKSWNVISCFDIRYGRMSVATSQEDISDWSCEESCYYVVASLLKNDDRRLKNHAFSFAWTMEQYCSCNYLEVWRRCEDSVHREAVITVLEHWVWMHVYGVVMFSPFDL